MNYTPTEIDTILEAMSAEFMVPTIVEDTWIECNHGPDGTEHIPADIGCEHCGEGVETTHGFGAYLSAPGYMDRTTVTVLPTLQEAKAHLVEMWGEDRCPKCGAGYDCEHC